MAWLYVKPDGNHSRFVLGKTGEKSLICIGINPSTAEPGKLDNTVKSVERLTLHNAFDSWIMLNVYPQKATDPKHIHLEKCEDLHQQNLMAIDQLFAGMENPVIWAAWGTLIEKRSYLFDCLDDIVTLSQKHNCIWKSVGKTKTGHPRHPLYLPKTSLLDDFDINYYMADFRKDWIRA